MSLFEYQIKEGHGRHLFKHRLVRLFHAYQRMYAYSCVDFLLITNAAGIQCVI